MKKIIAFAISAVISLAFSVTVSAYDNSGDEPFAYEVTDKGTVTIAYYRGEEQYVTIPNYIEGLPVTAIGENAFRGKNTVREVYLPTELRTIDENAFYRCSSLERIEFPDSLVYIGEAAFFQCEDLEYIKFGNGLEEIGEYAFEGCESIEGKLKLPGDLEEIGANAFNNCKSLTEVEFPKSLKEIGECSFAGCDKLEYVKFNDKKKAVSIGSRAFSCKKLESVIINHKTSIMFKNAFDESSPIFLKAVIFLIIAGICILIVTLVILIIKHNKKAKRKKKAAKLPTTRKCANCGNEIRIDAKFCTSCGTPQEPYIPPEQPDETNNGSDKKHKGLGFKIAVGSIITVIICGIAAIIVLFVVFKLDTEYIFSIGTTDSHSSYRDGDDDDDEDDDNDNYSSQSISVQEANSYALEAYNALDKYFGEINMSTNRRVQDEFLHGYYEKTYRPNSESSDEIERELSKVIDSGYVKLRLDYWDQNYLFFYVQWCDDEDGNGTIGQYPEALSEETERSARFGEIVSRK